MRHTGPQEAAGTVPAVISLLAVAGDPGRAARQQRYMTSVLPYRGLSTPELARHRHAAPWRTRAAVPLYRHLVLTGAWWDLVDETASHPGHPRGVAVRVGSLPQGDRLGAARGTPAPTRRGCGTSWWRRRLG